MQHGPLHRDTVPLIWADWLCDFGWTLADLEYWYVALLPAFLEAGGWESVLAALVLEEDSLSAAAWEFDLLNDR
jgi:hypothetical protein